LRKLRGSLLAQALENEPETATIDLPNAIVSSEHLDVIAMMAREEKLNLQPDWNDGSYQKAGEYLNWPLLEVVRFSAYLDWLEFAPYVDIYRPETYGSSLMWALSQHHQSIAKRSEEHTSELQSRGHLVCRLLL